MKRYTNNVILAFGDTHFPYEHKDTFEFLQSVKDNWDIDRVVHMGDLCDIYSVSSYPKDPNHPDSWSDEIKKAKDKVQRLGEMFPEMEVVESNHDDRAYKKSRLAGIPREFLITYSKVFGCPEGWRWHRDLSLTVDSTRDKIYFAHHKSGKAVDIARDKGCTTVLGHYHTRFGFQSCRPHKKNLYGIDAGCLVSDKGPPFAYNKMDRYRPVQGCVVIYNGIPMMEPLT